jgi:nicotinamidase-related amidase
MSKNPVLIVIDVQKGFLDEKWGNSNNPGCEDNIKKLLKIWRNAKYPVVLGQTQRPALPCVPLHQLSSLPHAYSPTNL